MSKWFTVLWGLMAILIACVADLLDNLINLVNFIGSVFYGNILGIFLLAFFIKFVKGRATFIAALANQILMVVAALWLIELYGFDKVPFLWFNVVGCYFVIAFSVLLQGFGDVSRKKEGAKTRLFYIILTLVTAALLVYWLLNSSGALEIN